MIPTAKRLKNKILLSFPFKAKIQGGFVHFKSYKTERWRKLYWIGDETKFSMRSQGFGLNPQWYAKYGANGHFGNDWATPVGVCLYAPIGAVVTRITQPDDPGYGGSVTIEFFSHDCKYLMVFGHLSEVLVKAGQKVIRGDLMALTGNTGASTGPHCHTGFADVTSGGFVNKDNGFLGYEDEIPLYNDIYTRSWDQMEEIYQFVKENKISFIGPFGSIRWAFVKLRLGIKELTRSHYYDYVKINRT